MWNARLMLKNLCSAEITVPKNFIRQNYRDAHEEEEQEANEKYGHGES